MSYRIGSFNMRRFGANPSQEYFEVFSNIIHGENLDIVALQEVFSEGKGVAQLLENYIKYQLRGWEFCWEKPEEPTDTVKNYNMQKGNTRGEGYAYLWNTGKFKLAEFRKLSETRIFDPRIINSRSRDVKITDVSLARSPYYIRFMPVHNGFFELRLINMHIYFGSTSSVDISKRQEEFEILTQKIYPAISQRRYGDFRSAYTIAMGDYNLNLLGAPSLPADKNACVPSVYQCNERLNPYTVHTIQDQLTTLKKCTEADGNRQIADKERYTNNFDHFSYSPELSHLSGVRCWRVDAVNKYCNGDFWVYNSKISDHLPIVMEIDI